MTNRRELLLGAAAAGLTTAAVASAQNKPAARSTGRIRVVELGEQQSLETLRFAERPRPTPARDQALVRVACSSLNARDIGIAQNIFFGKKPTTRIPLSEGAGEVIAVGEDVRNVKVGDRVTGCHYANWQDGRWYQDNFEADIGNTLDGWLGEEVLMPARTLARLPDAVSYETAATLASSAVTVWHALYHVARIKAGDIVLSLGTGGVSTWGTQLARAAGARVVVTSSSDDKLERMRALGADAGVNYRMTPEWGKAVLDATGGRGVDIVLENVGRATLDQSMNACAENATIVLIGTGPLPKELPRMPGVYQKNLTLKAISNGSRRMLEELLQAIAVNKLEGVIEQEFAFADAVEAYRFMRDGSRLGKVLIRHRAA
ncbi:MAG TPA: NAD(P)-dependent alcohol dehydrogenase [Steroidobacteraceae bacterium]|nr:NAD(P)-dependent alcohol dehydrogenase [Steroidobacteraceae bacterium]